VFWSKKTGIVIRRLELGACESVTNIQKIALHTANSTVHIQKTAECQLITPFITDDYLADFSNSRIICCKTEQRKIITILRVGFYLLRGILK